MFRQILRLQHPRIAPQPHWIASVRRTPNSHITFCQTKPMSGIPLARVRSLDHIVLTVADISTTVEFYTKLLGMRHEQFSSASDPKEQRHALRFGDQKINLHKLGAEFEPKAQNVMSGSGDLCFLSDNKVDEILAKLVEAKIQILEGGKVVERTGARGKLRSVYIRDPDGNLIEISNYV